MDLTDYHHSAREQARMKSLLSLVPHGISSALDIGARDGYVTRLLADRVPSVTALDLQIPLIDDKRICSVVGDATRLPFADCQFDLVFCAEVLEHIPEPGLSAACREIARVSARYVIIGVPLCQDIRHGRVTCAACGGIGPPWGHVNSFDELRLNELFRGLHAQRRELVDKSEPGTNAVSALLMDFAGNPYGTYSQEEPCIHCGQAIGTPPRMTVGQHLCARLALGLRAVSRAWQRTHANWIHLLLEKR